MSEKASQLGQAECPNCTARLWFAQALLPKFGTQGFESYELNCEYCGAALAGVIDPRDGALLLSTQASIVTAQVQKPFRAPLREDASPIGPNPWEQSGGEPVLLNPIATRETTGGG
jgi:hypothetical protein